MNDAEFWTLIATIDREQIHADEDAALGPLLAALGSLPRHELEGFEDTLAQKLYALDGRPFARATGPLELVSADGFLYARCFVVAQGREHYESVLRDPERMPSSLDDWFEAILYAASQAFETQTGEEWDYAPPVCYETGSNGRGWAE
jgi:hypothetical protein